VALLLITVVAALVAIGVTGLVFLSPITRTDTWRAIVTPLASIIGSGFLICGPFLAKEFGGAALPAMAALLLLAPFEPSAFGQRALDTGSVGKWRAPDSGAGMKLLSLLP
jgi:hypothetical protein